MLRYDSKSEMFVERGYLNRTRIYLYPAVVLMKTYRPAITDLKENLLCVSYKDESIVLYYDRKNTPAIKRLIESLKQNKEYINDWMHTEDSYAIQIKPELNYSAFEEGRYTDIYTKEQINQVFTKESKTRKVLIKDVNYKQEYVDLLNEWFNTNNTIEYLESRPDGSRIEISQYDLPPCLNQEIVDYERKEKRLKSGKIKPD